MIEHTPARRRYRSRTNVVFAGVAGGLAEYFNIDPTLMRVVLCLVLLAASGPLAPILYFILAVLVPQAPPNRPTT
jgi:phage shock protein C